MRLSIKIFSILILLSCEATNQKGEDITAINYIFNIPMVSADGQLDNMQDTTTIYYYQDLILYQLPYHLGRTIFTSLADSDTTEQENTQTTTRHNFLVYKQGNKNGLWYETMNGDEKKKVPVDSTLLARGLPVDLRAILSNPEDTLIETVKDAKEGIVIEKYISKTRPNDPCCYDTTLLYYSKDLKQIAFSFSPTLDSIKNLKLFKFRAAFNEAYSPQYLITMPKREIRYEIQQIKVVDAKTIKDLFQRYRQDEKLISQ